MCLQSIIVISVISILSIIPISIIVITIKEWNDPGYDI